MYAYVILLYFPEELDAQNIVVLKLIEIVIVFAELFGCLKLIERRSHVLHLVITISR